MVDTNNKFVEGAQRITQGETNREAILNRARLHFTANTMGDKNRQESTEKPLTSIDEIAGRAAVAKGTGQPLED